MQNFRVVNQTPMQGKGFLLLSIYQWVLLVPLALFFAIITAGYTWEISPWISVTVFVTVVAMGHMALSSQRILALPQIAILIAALQYVLAAWLSYYWPPSNPSYDISTDLEKYLSYAGLGLCASAMGWALALTGFGLKPLPRLKATPALLLELDILTLIGVAGLAIGNVLRIEGVGFALLLISNLRYVGVFGRMLVRGSGWSWRLGIVLLIELLFAAGAGMFHDLLLWCVWAFAVWAFSFAPRPVMILSVLIAVVFMLPALQESKWRLRDNPSPDDPWAEYERESLSGNAAGRAVVWVKYLVSAMKHTASGNIDPQFLSDIAVRYNQGWIVNRIMMFVPAVEPHAEGETIKNAILDAAVPRLFMPEKSVAGGKYLMARYAGMDLGDTTSMNVGYLGEMYINFGQWGGVLGCGLYTLGLGLLFRLLFQWAHQRPLLLGFVPFIFYAACKAEEDISFVFNWTVKASLIAAAIYFVVPTFRRLRRLRQGTRWKSTLPDRDTLSRMSKPFP